MKSASGSVATRIERMFSTPRVAPRFRVPRPGRTRAQPGTEGKRHGRKNDARVAVLRSVPDREGQRAERSRRSEIEAEEQARRFQTVSPPLSRGREDGRTHGDEP